MVRALVYIVPVALAIYALFDLARSLPEERVGIRRWAWVLIVVLIPVLGPLVWILVSRWARAQSGTPPTVPPLRPGPVPPRTGRPAGPARGPARPTRRSGPLPPDDDPEFLWRLEQQRRRASGEPPSADGPAPSGPSAPSDN